MSSKKKSNLGSYFKRGKLGWRILWLTFIFFLLFASIFAPFMLYENANRTLGLILLCVLGLVYLFIILIFVWDWLKEQDFSNKNSK